MLKQISVIETVLTTTFLFLLLCAAYEDIRKKRIPDVVVAGVFIVASAGLFLSEDPGSLEKAAGVFVVSVPMLVISVCAHGAFGGGDIKLMAAAGMFLGAADVFYSFFYALILGSIYSSYLVLYKNKSKKSEFAFGPFLVSGIYLRLIFHVFSC